MLRKLSAIGLAVLLLAVLLLRPAPQRAQAGYAYRSGQAAYLAALGSAFTYQGQLQLDGQPVSGTCDFQFGLWDAAGDGNQAGSTLAANAVNVSGGLFTANLDFGAAAFDGNARWLAVSVRCPSGSGSFTDLGRQALAPAPYAIYAAEAGHAAEADSALDASHATNADNAAHATDADSAANADNAAALGGQPGSYYQARIGGECAVGMAIQIINADGSVQCQPAAPGFTRSPLDLPGNVGLKTSIATGADGLGLISYYDNYNHTLKTAHCKNIACTSADLFTIAADGGDSWAAPITIGGDGLGLIAYYDSGNTDLKVAHCSDTPCSTADTFTLDSVDNVGRFASIVTGPDGLGLIAYYDFTNTALKMAHCDNAACSSATVYTVDNSDSVGGYTSIAIGVDGFGLIAYYDSTNTALKVAHCNNAACSSVGFYTLDSVDLVGQYTSIAVGADGLGLISYYDDTNGDLKLAHCNDTACSTAAITTADSSMDDVGMYTSIAIGADGLAVISYCDVDNYNLKVAHCSDVACSDVDIYLLDSEGSVGLDNSITIGSDGLGLISYRDSGNGNLKVAHCDDTSCAP